MMLRMAPIKRKVRRRVEGADVHVYPVAEKHEMTPECWCEPEVDTVTADGVTVWVHRERQ